MTIKEFSKKYRIPYNAVYEATYKVTPMSNGLHDREYPEEDLRREILKLTEERIRKHKRMLERVIQIRKRVSAE